MIQVIARIQVKPGKREEFLNILLANVPTVLAEEGCLGYTPCRDVAVGLGTQSPVDPDRITILECWASPEDLKRHLETPHMKRYAEQVRELRNGTELSVITPV